jgi:ATP citrate (pro-S)-lyase
MRRRNQLIMGIGHRVKSLQNPDMRVSIIKARIALVSRPRAPTTLVPLPLFITSLSAHAVSRANEQEFVAKHFPSHKLLAYALEVEQITTTKKPNLILNVDGAIAVAFVDLLRECGAFTMEVRVRF